MYFAQMREVERARKRRFQELKDAPAREVRFGLCERAAVPQPEQVDHDAVVLNVRVVVHRRERSCLV